MCVEARGGSASMGQSIIFNAVDLIHAKRPLRNETQITATCGIRGDRQQVTVRKDSLGG